MLSGLIRCRRCGSRWEGRKKQKGRPRADGTRVETRYYCCGGYIHKGRAVCAGDLVLQKEIEEAVVREVGLHLQEFFLEGDGQRVLEKLLVEASRPAGAQESLRAIERRIAEARKQLDTWVDSLTPEVSPVLGPRIAALQRQIADDEAELADRKRRQVSEDHCRALVADLMAHLGTVGELLQSGTLAEQRDVVRGLVEEIAWDGETREGEIIFRAVPRLSGTSPELIALDPSFSREDAGTSCAEVAGARSSREKTRLVQVFSRTFVLLRRAA
jgi:hypothetical protein